MRRAAFWLSPFAGAIAVALFLMIRALVMYESYAYIYFDFIAWFIWQAAVGYVCALPLLGIAYRLGLRHAVGFMLLASLAILPYDWYTSNPISAWSPTEKELEHGFYWDSYLPCVLLASVTGVVFSLGVPRKKDPSQRDSEERWAVL